MWNLLFRTQTTFFDTVQWWLGGGGCWRLRTYAIDHDIHSYKIGNSSQTTIELAQTNNQKNFGDIIKAHHVIHFVDCADPSELAAEFGRIGLCPRLEISPWPIRLLETRRRSLFDQICA